MLDQLWLEVLVVKAVTGRHARTRRENEVIVRNFMERELAERQTLINVQLQDRRSLQREMAHACKLHDVEIASIMHDAALLDECNGFLRAAFDEGCDLHQPPLPRKRRGPAP